MKKVQALIDAGATIPTAVKESLSMPLKDFADKHRLPVTTVSSQINGTLRPSEKVIAALIDELGGTHDGWADLLWQAGRPQPKELSA